MGNERSRIIEGTWKCTSCQTKGILARYARCPNCNNPREQLEGESDFDFGARTGSGGLAGAAVTDDQALQRASAGADWYCSFCHTANAGTLTACRHCGADQKERGGTAVEKELAPPEASAARPAKKSSRVLKTVAGVGLALLATCGTCTYLGFRTTELSAEQTGASWERVVHRERFMPVIQRGWQDELHVAAAVMPVNGAGELAGVSNVRDCQRKQRGTRKVADGTRRVCETKTRKVQCGTTESCKVVDMGNGFARETCTDVPKYCSESYESCSDETRYRDEPVFGDECAYDTFVWKRVETKSAKGSDYAPTWPELAPTSLDRLVREEKYRVELRYQDDGETKTHLHEPKSEKEFLSWRNRRKVTLESSAFGGVNLPEAMASDVP